MSLYIKGAKLPRSCIDCDHDEEAVCRITGTENDDCRFVSRHYSCPIVEVPAKHGRLIDVDAHIESLRENFCGDRCVKNHDCAHCGMDIYIRIVENEPVIIEVEE